MSIFICLLETGAGNPPQYNIYYLHKNLEQFVLEKFITLISDNKIYLWCRIWWTEEFDGSDEAYELGKGAFRLRKPCPHVGARP